MPITQVTSDTINLTNPTAGDANAGNGGDGTNNGDVFYTPVVTLAPTQTVDGADPTVFNGDIVGQTAGWGTGSADGGGLIQVPVAVFAALTNSGAGGAGGNPTSSGDQSNTSGGDTVTMGADTTGTQTTTLLADQSATILAGVGGAGGDGNAALGGDISAALVHSNPISETTTTTTTTTSTVSSLLDNFANSGIIDIA